MHGMDLVRRVKRVRVGHGHCNGRIAFVPEPAHNLLRDPPRIATVHRVVHPRGTALAVARRVANERVAVARTLQPRGPCPQRMATPQTTTPTCCGES